MSVPEVCSHEIVCVCVCVCPFSRGPGLFLVIFGAKDDRGDGDDWSSKTCKAPVKSSPSTNQHPANFLQARCPSCRPSKNVKALMCRVQRVSLT